MPLEFEEESIAAERASPYYDLSLFPYTPLKTPIHKKIKFGEVSFYTVFWPSIGLAKARLLFVHGLYEHSILYEELMDKLSSDGYECFFYDQRGCGLTSLGNFKGETNDHYITKDLNHFIELNHNQVKNKIPLYLVGHSLGGGIILDYLRNGSFKELIKGGIMTSPLILSDPLTKPAFLDHIMGFATKFSFTANYKFISKIKKEYLTTDQQYLDFLVSDTLAVPLVSISQLVDMFNKGKALLKGDYNLNDKTSLLIIHSKDDKVNSFKGSEALISKINKSGQSNVRLVESTGCHSLFIESEEIRNRVTSVVKEFLDSDIVI